MVILPPMSVVLIPFRVFLDSDTVKKVIEVLEQVLIPFRVFLDSDVH